MSGPLDEFARRAVSTFLAARGAPYPIRHVLAGTVLLVLGVLIAIAGAGCAVVALWVYLLPLVGPAKAALIAAASLFLPGCVLVAVGHRLASRHRRPLPAPALAAIPVAELFGLVRRHKLAALLFAVAIGLVVGSKPASDSGAPDRHADRE